MKFLSLLVSVVFLYGAVLTESKIINCYYGTWANYRSGNAKFDTTNIDPKLCTHLSYSFFGINDNSEIVTLDSWLDLDSGLGNIRKAINLKQQNPNLKVLAVVGGWNEGSTKYSQMAATAASRTRFINSAVSWVRQWGFDGLDLDWEYPAQRGGSAADKANFVTLLQGLKAAFAPYGLLLGIAVGASSTTASTSYNIPAISQTVDFINVMTYDFNTYGNGFLGHNAPLGGAGPNTVEASINYWLQQGAAPSKLILGTGFYGRTFQLANNQNTNPGAGSTGAGAAGPYTQESGYLGYHEICETLNTWTVKWDGTANVPYGFKGNQWVSYDNVQSINSKMDFLKTKNLGGAMVWSIETDDFRGNCGAGKFPLLNTINKAVGGTTTTPTPTPTPSPTPTPTPTPPPTPTPNTGNAGNCNTDGFFVNPPDCSRYYRCVSGVRFHYQCGAGLSFDTSVNVCNWASLVKCNV